jgi:hypothetical protein
MRLGLALIPLLLVAAATPVVAETPAEVTQSLVTILSSRICPADEGDYKHFRIRRLCAEVTAPGAHAACVEEIYHANRLIQRYDRFLAQCRAAQ